MWVMCVRTQSASCTTRLQASVCGGRELRNVEWGRATATLQHASHFYAAVYGEVESLSCLLRDGCSAAGVTGNND